MEYPQVRQVGLNLQAKVAGFGIELIHSNFKSATPGILGMRGSRSIIPKLSLGVSFVTDLDQLAGLPDSDGDNYPDYYDFYPDDSEKHDDSLYWRNIYGEITGGIYAGFDIWYLNSDGYNNYDPEGAENDPVSGMAFDVLKTVDMISSDISWSSAGMCGKKQLIPVGMGGPAIKCKVNIGGR